MVEKFAQFLSPVFWDTMCISGLH